MESVYVIFSMQNKLGTSVALCFDYCNLSIAVTTHGYFGYLVAKRSKWRHIDVII